MCPPVCTTLDEPAGREFLAEALPLVATYLYGASVSLEALGVGVAGGPAEDDFDRFLRDLADRHTLACSLTLRGIVTRIERNHSSWRTIARVESKGELRGRLDVPRYLARRTVLSLPRTYPLIISVEDLNTPENILGRRLLHLLTQQVAKVRFPIETAEARLAAEEYVWMRARAGSLPWAEVGESGSLSSLGRQVEGRIRRRQTGNEAAYEELLAWMAEWQVDVATLGGPIRPDRIVAGLLAFPTDDFFWDRVFEIWCLRETARALERLGFSREHAAPLSERHRGPIFKLRRNAVVAEVWFQRQEPVGKPRWRYRTSGSDMVGIPDVVVRATDRAPLLIDAKARLMGDATKPEESYKMLGYLENFRDTFGAQPYHGVLMFYGPREVASVLEGPNSSRLTLLNGATGSGKPSFEANIDGAIRSWLG